MHKWAGKTPLTLSLLDSHSWQWNFFSPCLDERLPAQSHDYCKLVNVGCGLNHERVEDGCRGTCVKFRDAKFSNNNFGRVVVWTCKLVFIGWIVNQDFDPIQHQSSHHNRQWQASHLLLPFFWTRTCGLWWKTGPSVHLLTRHTVLLIKFMQIK